MPTSHAVAESLCLDYSNSVPYSTKDEHPDVLRSAEALGRWGRRLGLVSHAMKPATEAELCRGRTLREALYRIFYSVSQDQQAGQDDLVALMSSYVEGTRHASLLLGEDGYQLNWSAHDPRRIRYAVAADAVALLQDRDRLRRVSRCPGRGCGWLFLNASGRRRWCSMSTCGSREKMRRLYQRQTQQAA